MGKELVNAKAMSNKTVAAKLFVYGLDKNDVLIPTCGFGDYLYYAMWISGTHALSSFGMSYVFVAFNGMCWNNHTVNHRKSTCKKRWI